MNAVPSPQSITAPDAMSASSSSSAMYHVYPQAVPIAAPARLAGHSDESALPIANGQYPASEPIAAPPANEQDVEQCNIFEHYVCPPQKRSQQSKERLVRLWDEMESLFASNAPQPRRLWRPMGWRKPNKPRLLSYTAEMADRRNLMSSEDASQTRLAHQRIVDALPEYPDRTTANETANSADPMYPNRRGIIILAGSKFTGYAATTLSVLRSTGSTLPVEIWTKDEAEENSEWCAEIEQTLGASCRRLSDYLEVGSKWDWLNPMSWLEQTYSRKRAQLWSAYQWKALITIFSTFDEFLLLDADSMPFVNPDKLFDWQVYRETGAVLWPDKWKSVNSPWLPYLVGLSDSKSDMLFDLQTVESGQLVWNRRKHWKVGSQLPVIA